MASTINIPLFMFSIIIIAALASVVYILPANISANFPAYANPRTIDANIVATAPSSTLMSWSISLNQIPFVPATCGYLDVGCEISNVFTPFADFFVGIFIFIMAVVLIIASSIAFMLTLVIFALTSSYFLFATLPIFLTIPLDIFLITIEGLIFIDICFAVRDLIGFT